MVSNYAENDNNDSNSVLYNPSSPLRNAARALQ